MRIKQSRLKNYYIRQSKIEKDSEGGKISVHGEAVPFMGVVWPASGKMQAEIYGQRLSYILNVKIDGKYVVNPDGKKNGYIFDSGLTLCEGDGACIYVSPEDEPDYKIISIKPYTPLHMEVEKI